MNYKDEEFSQQVAHDVAIEQTDLNASLINQASLFAMYSAQAIKAMREADKAKLKIDIIEAQLSQSIRDKAAADGEKITEKGIEIKILTDKRYIEAVMTYNTAKGDYQMLRDVLDALKQKKDCVIQLCLMQRDEMKAQNNTVKDEGYENLQVERAAFSSRLNSNTVTN